MLEKQCNPCEHHGGMIENPTSDVNSYNKSLDVTCMIVSMVASTSLDLDYSKESSTKPLFCLKTFNQAINEEICHHFYPKSHAFTIVV